MAEPMLVPVIHGVQDTALDRPDERDTLEVAAAVAASLDRLGFETEIVGIGLDLTAIERIGERQPLAIFNLCEALCGDGRLAATVAYTLEHCRLAYTGARAASLALSNSKIATKLALSRAGVPTPAWWTDAEDPAAGERVIVKSVHEHASLGIDAGSVVQGYVARREIASRLERFGGEFFAEAFIAGREFNVAILASPNGPQVLPIQEIIFTNLGQGPAIVDYAAKWDPHSHGFHNTPRQFGVEQREPQLAAELIELSLACWRSLRLSGYARVDFRVDEDGRPFVLEVNTNPCLAKDAGFMAAANQVGFTFDQVIAQIVSAANVPQAREPHAHVRQLSGNPVPCAAAPAKDSPIVWRQTVHGSDLAAIRSLVAATGMFTPAEVDIAVELVAERLEKGPASGYEFLIAERDERIVGYACFGPTPATVGTFDLYWIVVSPDCQGHGIGQALLDRVEQSARGMGAQRLFAETSSQEKYTPTRTFYGRTGFRRVAELPDYYRQGDSNVVFAKAL